MGGIIPAIMIWRDGEMAVDDLGITILMSLLGPFSLVISLWALMDMNKDKVIWKRKSKKTEAGFTLIELLVVVGILSLLVAIVLVTLSDARKKAEDPEIKSCITEKVREMDRAGKTIGWAEMNTIENHCSYLNEYK